MTVATSGDPPSVSLSFANNFWGKEDAGVAPLLERMHNAKVCGDELRAFYTARTAIEDEYARKLHNLARKPLGSSESGTLRMSLDVIRGEVESMGKAHQNIANQMKTELDEPLAAFTGGMKERRKIVQIGIEKLLKTKSQQASTVNKARDRYEQDCLKIKGYLAQGHMVMGQEERKNKAKLEKTQIQLSTTSNEYEAAVKVLEETTGKWNRDWKLACDKFQDLEEERIDFMKSSLWSFANISSTVCVSDDASCEKIRLSLEECDVQKDITSFIKECGTGQEIPDAPKFINFCRGDINDTASEVSDDGNYSVAQFQRTMNPAFRSSSPQHSAYDPAHDLRSSVAGESSLVESGSLHSNSHSNTPKKPLSASIVPSRSDIQAVQRQTFAGAQEEDLPHIPHNEYPMDGMTQFCRLGPPSELSSAASPVRPSSGDSRSECSNPTSFSSQEPSLGAQSPTKQVRESTAPNGYNSEVERKRGGFFQNRSPFRRKSKSERQRPHQVFQGGQANNITVASPSATSNGGLNNTSTTRHYGQSSRVTQDHDVGRDRLSASPEPVDPRASFQLNVGNNVFDVASPDNRSKLARKPAPMHDELDPIAQALAELKGVTKQSSVRISADRYHGLATSTSESGFSRASNTPKPVSVPDRMAAGATRGTPPPSYDQPSISRLGAPEPAFTSRQMQQTTQKYIDQKQNIFSSPSRNNSFDHQRPQQTTTPSRPNTQGSNGLTHSRATSPAPYRSTSPRPAMYSDPRHGRLPRPTSPNPHAATGFNNAARPRAQSSSPLKPRHDGYGIDSRNSSYAGPGMPRALSPRPGFNRPQTERPVSSGGGDMSLQLAPAAQPQQFYQQQQRGSQPVLQATGRPSSHYGESAIRGGAAPYDERARGRSAATGGQFTKDGRPILQFARAQYMYRAQIPEELSFSKGDVLAVLRLQDDGWWEAEVVGKGRAPGLVPSNYLVVC